MSVYFFIYKTKFKTFQIIYIKYPIKKEIKYIFDILFHLFIGKIFVRNYTHILMKIHVGFLIFRKSNNKSSNYWIIPNYLAKLLEFLYFIN